MDTLKAEAAKRLAIKLDKTPVIFVNGTPLRIYKSTDSSTGQGTDGNAYGWMGAKRNNSHKTLDLSTLLINTYLDSTDKNEKSSQTSKSKKKTRRRESKLLGAKKSEIHIPEVEIGFCFPLDSTLSLTSRSDHDNDIISRFHWNNATKDKCKKTVMAVVELDFVIEASCILKRDSSVSEVLSLLTSDLQKSLSSRLDTWATVTHKLSKGTDTSEPFQEHHLASRIGFASDVRHSFFSRPVCQIALKVISNC